MRFYALFFAALTLTACVTAAESEPEVAGIDWHLLGLEGQEVAWDSSIRFDGDKVGGKAPCNRWFASNEAAFPDLAISRIGATRMACPDLDKEQAFFDTLQAMQRAELDQGHLYLIGPEGRLMEFARDRDQPCLSCLARQ
jgi:heat shock protein HslJ